MFLQRGGLLCAWASTAETGKDGGWTLTRDFTIIIIICTYDNGDDYINSLSDVAHAKLFSKVLPISGHSMFTTGNNRHGMVEFRCPYSKGDLLSLHA